MLIGRTKTTMQTNAIRTTMSIGTAGKKMTINPQKPMRTPSVLIGFSYIPNPPVRGSLKISSFGVAKVKTTKSSAITQSTAIAAFDDLQRNFSVRNSLVSYR